MATVHQHPQGWTAHVLVSDGGPIGDGGRIEVYRHGTFAGCLYWRADGSTTMPAKLAPIREWLQGLVPGRGRSRRPFRFRLLNA